MEIIALFGVMFACLLGFHLSTLFFAIVRPTATFLNMYMRGATLGYYKRPDPTSTPFKWMHGDPQTEKFLKRWPAYMTYEYDEHAGHLYYLAPVTEYYKPSVRQIEVRAIIDITEDGTFNGVELIDNTPEPPDGIGDYHSTDEKIR